MFMFPIIVLCVDSLSLFSLPHIIEPQISLTPIQPVNKSINYQIPLHRNWTHNLTTSKCNV